MASGYLSNIVDIDMGQSPPGETCSEVAIGTPLLNGPTEFGPHHPTPTQWTTDPRKMARAGDILFCVRGSTTGRMNWADQDYAIGRGIAAIRHKKSATYQHFVRGVIESKLPSLLAAATGSTFPNVSRSQLLELPCEIPSLPEQKTIAHILGTLDDKIELNRRMNETLEGIAHTIFKSWFVDFDPVHAKADDRDTGLPAKIADLFPDTFEDSDLGPIPKGWEVQSLTDFADVIGGGTPKTSIPEYWGGSIPWFSVVDTPRDGDIFVMTTEKTVTQEGIDNSSAKVLERGTIIITARGTVGNLALTGVPMAMNQSCYALRDNSSSDGFFLYFSIAGLLTTLKTRTHGSVFDTITRNILSTLSVIVPPQGVRSEFESMLLPLMQEILVNLGETASLQNCRDSLLPTLLSGEIELPEAEAIAKETCL